MRKTITILAALACAASLFAQPQLNKDNVEEVLGAMTLQEKAALCVGGSRMVNIDGIPTGSANLVPGAAGTTRAIPRLGIPATVLADGPAGLRISPTREGSSKTFYCTGFPVGTLLASSWDLALVESVTEAMGNEVLEYGVDVLLAPGMNIHRNPLCGRNFEYFSEDPLLSGKMAAAYVNGIQKNGVGTSIKHYAANNQETNRNMNDAKVSVRALREIYLKNFEIAVKESDPWTVMSSYNQLNGEFTQQSHDLLTKVLREDWGYKGIVMTDWGNKEGTVKAVQAQNDLMEPGAQSEIERIIAAVKDGSLSEADLDRNVRNILNYIVRTPRFQGYKYSDAPDLKAHAAVARSAAAESMVLLRNEGALPLSGSEKVAMYGVSSIDFVAGGTGSGNVNKAYVVNMKQGLENAGFKLDQDLVNYYESYIKYNSANNKLNGGNSNRPLLGTSKLAEIPVGSAAIKSQAKSNDVAIITIGRNAGEGADRKMMDDFELTAVERELIQNVSSAFHLEGKKVVVVLNIGGVIETNSWKDMVDAILLPWSPGQEGANAVADVLTGKANPSGKLPMTFPVNFTDHPSSANFPYDYTRPQNNSFFRGPAQPVKDVDYTDYDEGIYVGYRHFTTSGTKVSYPFGYGLSYTDFAYSKPVVKAGTDGFTATVTVTNTGSVSGKEVVELYVSAPAGGMDKPKLELKAFAKTRELQPGESQTLTLSVDNYSLASFNEANSSWETAAGSYKVFFSKNVDAPQCSGEYKLKKAQSWKVNTIFE
ncbi:MAG: glycoside hydrolase family 3 C-terminal domain-containing protein [Candidatus Cryptobacteroides sp.]|nr:glycoside hydrolase family 3 C-terminal domain-containing protein [Rikenellaceae bacterium]MDY5747295.1 glycoside hydrolase family 3 C-terminal domain-containing protein [Candidatus Cryptobacteroides sp.]